MQVIDSHTGGEPTRVILDGFPDLGAGPLSNRAKLLATRHRDICRAVLLEPRGQVAMVAALLVPPTDPTCVTGVIYFDVAAVLGMCGHGTIGLAATLFHLGRINVGQHRIETPAGVVTVDLKDSNTVRVTNIESRRTATDVTINVPGIGSVTGDVAYGGNWFFLIEPSPIAVTQDNIGQLTAAGIAIRSALRDQGIGGDNGAEIDHIIFYGPAGEEGVDNRNFVLCPDDTYDRSPCGTGCSARLACLADAGRLDAGQEIVQYSIIGSAFTLSYQPGPNGGVVPSITGQAFMMAAGELIFEEADPFRRGIQI